MLKMLLVKVLHPGHMREETKYLGMNKKYGHFLRPHGYQEVLILKYLALFSMFNIPNPITLNLVYYTSILLNLTFLDFKTFLVEQIY